MHGSWSKPGAQNLHPKCGTTPPTVVICRLLEPLSMQCYIMHCTRKEATTSEEHPIYYRESDSTRGHGVPEVVAGIPKRHGAPSDRYRHEGAASLTNLEASRFRHRNSGSDLVGTGCQDMRGRGRQRERESEIEKEAESTLNLKAQNK